jgi:alkaline phosphatase
MRHLIGALLFLSAGGTLAQPPRSAIFLHPDGMGANTWNALRMRSVGPDGRLAWDRLPRVAIYVGPTNETINQSSNAGATAHAYGVRADLGSYGLIGGKAPTAASGRPMSLMREAQTAGMRVAIINSSSVTEPGTGAFLAQTADRDDECDIARQILVAKPDIVLGGGERYFLPSGVRGRHGEGACAPDHDLIALAREAGYVIVYDREELAALAPDVSRVLGLFAADETFNEDTEAGLQERGLTPFQTQAPRFDDMLAFALDRLRNAPKGYLIVGNEEGTDNLSGENNVSATLEAAAGADRAIALALREARRHPALTVIVASDSDNGGMNATSDDLDEIPLPLPERSENGSPLSSDGGKPFFTPPDALGRRLPYYILWASNSDMAGGTVARGIGPGSEYLAGTIDSTDVYRALYLGLFGRHLPPAR